MTKEYEIGDADHALDRNQQFGLLRGNGHIEGGPAVLDDEASPPTVTAPTPWSVYVDGETVDIDGENNTVELPQPHPTLDRWDVIYVDPDGELQVESGEPAQVIGERGLQAREPAPPSFAEIDGVVIAAAYRQFDEADGAAFALSELFFDRRVRTLADVESLSVRNATVESAPESEADVVRKLEADELQDNINSLDTAFTDHSERHQNNGEDELNVEGLSGDLADRQDPKDHQDRHHEGGPDAIAEGSLARQNPTNHGERHHSGAPDPIDPADLDLIGDSGLFLSGTGWDTLGAASSVQAFETSGTWEKPGNTNLVYVEVFGGGAGGNSGATQGSFSSLGGEGGAAGGFVNSIISADNLPEEVPVTVGAGGAGGVPEVDSDRQPGEDGGDTSFGDYLSAFGGSNDEDDDGGEGESLQFDSIKGAGRSSSNSDPGNDASLFGSAGGGGGGLGMDQDPGGDGGSTEHSAGGSGGAAETDGDPGEFRSGGGGGGGSNNDNPGDGGDGGLGGGGGGGGGGNEEGTDMSKGLGGDGGSGFVLVVNI